MRLFGRMNDIILFYSNNPSMNTFNLLTVPSRDSTRYKRGYHTVNDGSERRLLVYDMEKALAEKIDFSRYDRVVETNARDSYMGQVWNDISIVNPQAKERLGYPTQKPLALLDRIIKASSNLGDVVLDPFCGCGTTAHAAESLGRRWIGIDISPFSTELVRERIVGNFRHLNKMMRALSAYQRHFAPRKP